MDFSLTDEQRALADLAGQILTDRCTLERLKAIERSDDRYDRDLWAEFAKAGLLGAALPESVGGSGGGFVEICLLLRAARTPRRDAAAAADARVRGAADGALRLRRAAAALSCPAWSAGETLLTAALTRARR